VVLPVEVEPEVEELEDDELEELVPDEVDPEDEVEPVPDPLITLDGAAQVSATGANAQNAHATTARS